MKRTQFLKITLFIFTIIFLFGICNYTVKSAITIKANKDLVILIDVTEEKLYLIDINKNIILKRYPIASGKSQTPTPLGSWNVVNKATAGGVFGTKWIALNVPWGHYGIHGTNMPKLINYHVSHGCVRMFNKDVNELYKYVYIGMKVNIYAGPKTPLEKGLRPLKPGDEGAAVLQVQKKMKDIGYYPGTLDGIYDEKLKQYVLKFRKENQLPTSDNIDYNFYTKLGMKNLYS